MSDTAFLQGLLEHFGGMQEVDAKRVAPLADIWAAARERLPEIDDLFSTCESPMERSFLMAAFSANKNVRIIDCDRETATIEPTIGGVSCFTLYLQATFDDENQETFARVDFWIPEVGLVVEIDGHEFHEKTKEQAARDKARDRKLTWWQHGPQRILRFTGSEVYANPCACWDEVVATIAACRLQRGAMLEAARDRVMEELTAPPALPAAQETATGASSGPIESSGSNDEVAAE